MMSEHAIVQTQTAIKPTFTSIANGVLQRQCACGNHTIAGGECEECRKKGEGTLQRAAAPVSKVPPVVHEVLRSPGQPLDPVTLAFMEPRFGHDFSNVRVHTDAKASKSAEAVNALAYTVGRDIVFAAAQYRPETTIGKQLLAHEMAHVVQQSMVNLNALVGQESDNLFLDAEATRASYAIVKHHETFGQLSPAPVGLARARRYPPRDTTPEQVRDLVRQLRDAIPESSRGFKTVAVGLVEDSEGYQPLVYTVNGNWTNEELEERAAELGIERWSEVNPRAPGRGKVGAPNDAEQLLIEICETSEFKLLILAPSRPACPDCKLAVEAEGGVYLAEPVVTAGETSGESVLLGDPLSSVTVEPEMAPTEQKSPASKPVKGKATETAQAPPTASASSSKGETGKTKSESLSATGKAFSATPSPIPQETVKTEKLPSNLIATKNSTEQFSPRSPIEDTPSARAPMEGAGLSISEKENAPSAGAAMEGVGFLIIEIENALKNEAAVRNSRLAGSLRTLRWWLQRGVEPSAKGIVDRYTLWWLQYGLLVDNEVTTDINEIVKGAAEGKFDGVEIERLNSPHQYERFKNWVRANIHTWDDFYRHFISNEDAGVRWNGSKWELTTWEWGDWFPPNVSKEMVEDDRISAIMEPIRRQVMAQTQKEIEEQAQKPYNLGQGSKTNIVGARRFRKGSGTIYSPITMTPLMYRFNFDFEPVFYEIAGAVVPEKYLLVSGADLRTYVLIHDLRAYYDRYGPTSPTIGSLSQYDENLSFLGLGPINIPVVLVEKNSLIDASN